MAKAGLAVPAAAPIALPCYGSVLADIGDEQSLSASLSTFSGHLRRIEVSMGISVVQRPPSCGLETAAKQNSNNQRAGQPRSPFSLHLQCCWGCLAWAPFKGVNLHSSPVPH